MRIRTTVTINRPIQEVWAYLEDHNNDLEWRRPSLKSLETVGTGAVGPGTKYEGVVAMGPMKYPYVSELTEYKPPNRVAWKGVSSAGWMIGREGSMTLEAEGQDRTNVTHEITMEPQTAFGKVVAPVVERAGSRLVMPLLKQLKEAVEETPP
ncbi:MAG TPA: SRPBCC family protein [Candidatus Eisenbacteria bacterium]|nr:SRPBCC family protein [Candidatus Eisenbacteria bacterium]